MTTLRNIRLLADSLRDIQQTGKPRIPGKVKTLPNGQVAAEGFPTGLYDKLMYGGLTGEIWMEPGVTEGNPLWWIHGRGPGDWWAVGENGYALHNIGTGRTQDDVHADRVVSGKAWAEYCDTLKAAGNSLIFLLRERFGFDDV